MPQVVNYLLKHNIFMFDKKFYLQFTGPSMGAKFSPSLPNVFMSWWEYQYDLSTRNPVFGCFVWYGRYIDDLIYIWGSDVAAIPDCVTYFNNNSFGLKFTHSVDSTLISYLDLTLSGDHITGKVHSVSFRKETAGNTILRANSCHSKHTIRDIPVGELTRMKRNCSLPEDFSCQAGDHLHQWGYPVWILNRALRRVQSVPRFKLLSNNMKTRKTDNSKIPMTFSTTFNAQYGSISKIIEKYLPMFYSDPACLWSSNKAIEM